MLVATMRRNRIMEHIDRQGLTVSSLARAADMSNTTAYNLARAPQIPDGVRWGTLKKIAAILKVSVCELETEQ